TSPRWSTSTCGRWRRRSSRSASQSSKTTPRPPACRPIPTHDGNVDGRSPTHAAAAAAVAEPAEQARESSRPRTPDFFHLEGPWGYARRHRGQARSPARRGNGAGGRQVHSHPLAAPGRKVIDQALQCAAELRSLPRVNALIARIRAQGPGVGLVNNSSNLQVYESIAVAVPLAFGLFFASDRTTQACR